MFSRIVIASSALIASALASSAIFAQSPGSCLPSPVIIVPVCSEASISGNAEYVVTAYTTGIDRESGTIVWDDRGLKQWREPFFPAADSRVKQAENLARLNRTCQAFISNFPRN